MKISLTKNNLLPNGISKCFNMELKEYIKKQKKGMQAVFATFKKI